MTTREQKGASKNHVFHPYFSRIPTMYHLESQSFLDVDERCFE